MRGKTRALTSSALFAALCVILLTLTLVLPTQRLALLCCSSMGVVAALCLSGWKWALGVYAVSTVLSFLLLPEKTVALAYGLFCGYYPVLKLRVEAIPHAALRWLCKLLAFDLAAIAFFLLAKVLTELALWVLFLVANGAFLLYDFALSKLILLYSRKIAGRIEHG